MMMSTMMVIAAGLFQVGPFDDCQALVQTDAGVDRVPAPWASDAISSGALPPVAGDGQAGGLMCARDSIIPLAGDERVLIRLGLPLYIAAGERVGVLEASGGQVTFRLLTGQLNEEEVPAMMDFLNTAQNAAQDSPVEDDE